MRTPLGQWQYRSHQTWIWKHDYVNDCLYKLTGRVFVQCVRDPTVRHSTRSGHKWYVFNNIVTTYSKQHTRLCTVERTTTTKALWTSTSYSVDAHLHHMMHQPTTPPQLIDPYYALRKFSDDDDGIILAQRMYATPSLVESLNYECDLIAKFATVHMQTSPHL